MFMGFEKLGWNCKVGYKIEFQFYQKFEIFLKPLKKNHRIIESFGSEGTPRGHLVQPPRSEQGHH